MLALGLLVNCTEQHAANRQALASMSACGCVWCACSWCIAHRSAGCGSCASELPSPAGGGDQQPACLLLARLFAARSSALGLDAVATGSAATPPQQQGGDDDIDADDLVSAAYLALLLGCAVRDHAASKAVVAAALPAGSFEPLVQVLRAFVLLQMRGGMLTREALDTVNAVLPGLGAPPLEAHGPLHAQTQQPSPSPLPSRTARHRAGGAGGAGGVDAGSAGCSGGEANGGSGEARPSVAASRSRTKRRVRVEELAASRAQVRGLSATRRRQPKAQAQAQAKGAAAAASTTTGVAPATSAPGLHVQKPRAGRGNLTFSLDSASDADTDGDDDDETPGGGVSKVARRRRGQQAGGTARSRRGHVQLSSARRSAWASLHPDGEEKGLAANNAAPGGWARLVDVGAGAGAGVGAGVGAGAGAGVGAGAGAGAGAGTTGGNAASTNATNRSNDEDGVNDSSSTNRPATRRRGSSSKRQPQPRPRPASRATATATRRTRAAVPPTSPACDDDTGASPPFSPKRSTAEKLKGLARAATASPAAHPRRRVGAAVDATRAAAMRRSTSLLSALARKPRASPGGSGAAAAKVKTPPRANTKRRAVGLTRSPSAGVSSSSRRHSVVGLAKFKRPRVAYSRANQKQKAENSTAMDWDSMLASP